MRYQYLCGSCLHDQEINKPLKQIDRPEPCPKCGAVMTRQISAVSNVWKTDGNADR